MSRFLCFSAALLALSTGSLYAQTLVEWNFDDNDAVPDTVASTVTVTDLVNSELGTMMSLFDGTFNGNADAGEAFVRPGSNGFGNPTDFEFTITSNSSDLVTPTRLSFTFDTERVGFGRNTVFRIQQFDPTLMTTTDIPFDVYGQTGIDLDNPPAPTLVGVTSFQAGEEGGGNPGDEQFGTVIVDLSGVQPAASLTFRINCARSGGLAPEHSFDDLLIEGDVAAPPQLALTLSSDAPVKEGDDLTFSVSIENTDAMNDATFVQLQLPSNGALPAGYALETMTTSLSQGMASESGGIVTWDVGTITAGSTVTADIVVATADPARFDAEALVASADAGTASMMLMDVLVTFIADTDLDGDVDTSDFFTVANAFGTVSADVDYNAAGDLDGSMTIDLDDFATLAADLGHSI